MKSIKKNRAAFVAAVFLFIATLAAAPAAEGPPLEELLKQASAARAAGDGEKAAAAWKLAADGYPQDQRVAEAWFGLGNYHLEKKNYGLAYSYFSTAANQFSGAPLHNDALIGLGASLNGLKRWQEAESALRTVLPLVREPQKRAEVFFHLGEALFLAGKNGAAIETLMECWNIPGDRREASAARIREILHVTASEKELLEVADKYQKGFPAQVALGELSRLYGRKGDLLNSERFRARLERDFPGAALPNENAPAAPVPQTQPQAITVGCVLPLSGEMGDAASQALKGIQLAFLMKSAFVERAKLRLTIKDSGGSPDGAAASMKELAADAGVVAAVGMFGAQGADAAIAEARPAELPVINPIRSAFTGPADDKRRYLYEAGLTDAGQAHAIARYAVKTAGVSAFTAIYPEGPAGEAMLAAFTKAAEQDGGAVVQSVKYDPSQTDFRAQMEAIGGLDDNAMRSVIFNYVQEHPDLPLETINANLASLYGAALSAPSIIKVKTPPITKNNFLFSLKMNYGGVFIAGGYEEVGLILPALAFYNITGVKVFGTDNYLDPGLIKISGKYAEDVVFPAEFWVGNPRHEVKEFVEAFDAALGGKPDGVAACYYDAMMLLLSVMENGGGSRQKVAAALDSLKYSAGISGGLYSVGGGLMKVPSIFTVKAGAFKEIELPSPPPEESNDGTKAGIREK